MSFLSSIVNDAKSFTRNYEPLRQKNTTVKSKPAAKGFDVAKTTIVFETMARRKTVLYTFTSLIEDTFLFKRSISRTTVMFFKMPLTEY